MHMIVLAEMNVIWIKQRLLKKMHWKNLKNIISLKTHLIVSWTLFSLIGLFDCFLNEWKKVFTILSYTHLDILYIDSHFNNKGAENPCGSFNLFWSCILFSMCF